MRLAALIALVLTACAPIQSVSDRHTRGQPPTYRHGFEDGCGSGYVAAGHPYSKFAKRMDLYLSDPLYKAGWDDGMTICKGDYESVGRALYR